MSLCCKRHTLAKDTGVSNVDSQITVLKSSVAPERTTAKAYVTWIMQRQAVATVAIQSQCSSSQQYQLQALVSSGR